MSTMESDVLSIRSQIEKGNKTFMAVVDSGDAEGFKDVYTEDAVLMPANTPTIKGLDGIKNFFGGAFKSGINKAELITEELQEADDFAAETGRYKLFASSS